MTTSSSLQWGMFCDHFLIDAAGKYSFIGVFERIGAPSFPAVHKALWIACALAGEPNAESSAVVSIWSPSNNLLVSTNESPLRYSNEGRTMLVHLLYDTTFPEPGSYTVVIEVGGRPAGELKLELYQAPQPPGAGQA
jgi:hypothetical protein